MDTRDLPVAGVRISISSKYLYLYLSLSGSTFGDTQMGNSDSGGQLKTITWLTKQNRHEE